MSPGISQESSGRRWLEAVLATFVCYLLIVLFFRALVFSGQVFTGSPDTTTALIFERWGRALMNSGVFPLWNPFVFGGMPSFGSLQFTPGVYPVEWIRPLYRALFLNASSATILFHHLLGGLFAFLMLRDLRLRPEVALLGAVVFFFSPQEIVLGPVSHGGKLFTIAWLPLVFLATRRLLRRPGMGSIALLAVALGLQLLALHMQIAYYGLMMVGLYFIVDAFQQRKTRTRRGHLVRLGALISAGVVALALASYLLWPVYEYSQFSIRGGSAVGGGVSWEYATSWSFHPLELLTLIVPGWFGFGGPTYWGYMPFTDHPYYMGVVPLLLAIVALLEARERRSVQVLGLLGALALLVSFGNWLPVLYGPLFRILPFFARFRIPAMIMILVLLATAGLAALGLAALFDSAGEARAKWARRLRLAGIVSAVLFLIVLAGKGALEGSYVAAAARKVGAADAAQAYGLFWADLVRVSGITTVAALVLHVALRGRIPIRAAAIALLVLVTADLWVVNARLVDTSPKGIQTDKLLPDGVATFLKEQEGPFRILNRGDQVAPNYWMAQGIEDAEGYSPAKLRIYQELLEQTFQKDRTGVYLPNVMAMLNIRYLIWPAAIQGGPVEEVFTEGAAHVYAFGGALGPAWITGEVTRVRDDPAVLGALTQGMDVSKRTLTTEAIGPLDAAAAASGSVELLERGIHTVRYRVQAAGPVLLVASEIYYPAGWEAEVGGEPAVIHRVDHVLRGVRVDPGPAGSVEVVMHFAPRSVEGGRILAILALLVIAALGTTGLVRARIRRPETTGEEGSRA